jgi:hypothetical protein
VHGQAAFHRPSFQTDRCRCRWDVARACASNQTLRRILPTAERTVIPVRRPQQPKTQLTREARLENAPPRCKKNFRIALSRSRLLPCVRPLVRRECAAGPYGSPRIRSTSLERARSATRGPGSSDPVSPTLRHTCGSAPNTAPSYKIQAPPEEVGLQVAGAGRVLHGLGQPSFVIEVEPAGKGRQQAWGLEHEARNDSAERWAR